MQATSVKERAEEALAWFREGERLPEGVRFVTLAHDRPEWLMELVHKAHGDMLPDDYRYKVIQEALEDILNNDGLVEDNEVHEFADNVDVYLFAWVSSNLARVAYCDEYMAELPSEKQTFCEVLSGGQYLERQEIYQSVLASLRTS